MRKYVYTFSLCLAALWTAALFSGVLRLHVIANSDSPADQSIKLAVRDAALQYQRDSGPLWGAGAAEANVMRGGAGLQQAVERALAERGAEYGAELRLGSYRFPEREYQGVTYPAGEYEALRIVLGEGAGQNWWCVMFPPLCIVEAEDGDIKEEVKFESLILNLIREASDEQQA